MLGILIFDHMNDLIYSKSDQSFLRHVQGMAVAQGLTSPTEVDNVITVLEPNLVVQLFSPLITSHQVMDVQFGNPYCSISCHDDTTLCMQKYECSVVVVVGRDTEEKLQRLLSIVLRLIKLLVGPQVVALRECSERRDLLSELVWNWLAVVESSQCYLVEAVERLLVGPQVAAAAVQVLAQVLEELKGCAPGITPCHALLLVRNKLLALYSSRSAQELCAGDVLLLNLLVQSNNTHQEAQQPPTLQHVTLEQLEGEEAGLSCHSALVLLKTELSVFTPHLVHYTTLHHNLALVVVSEVGRSRCSGSSLSLLNSVSAISSGFGGSVEVCEATLLQTKQLAARLPSSDNTPALTQALDKVEQQWRQCLRCGLSEWRAPAELPSRLEAALNALEDGIRTAWQQVALHPPSPTAAAAHKAALRAREKLAGYAEFIDVKAMTNHKFECRALTANRYMDDFPGLVHFIYIDRTNHQMTAPSLDFPEIPSSATEKCESNEFEKSCEATRRMTKERVWSMAEFARSHLANGQHSVMWKDTTFSYAYFLWFEDKNNIAQSPDELDEDVLSALPAPGIISEDFYRLLTAHSFPSLVPDRLQVFEVFCVHLGLVTAPCVLEQTRRLLASVWEATGEAACNPVDLL